MVSGIYKRIFKLIDEEMFNMNPFCGGGGGGVKDLVHFSQTTDCSSLGK